MKNIILSILFLIPTYSFALIDLSTMSYTNSWQDLPELGEMREYKQNATSVFGKNWCSILDYQNSCKNYSIKKISPEVYQVTTKDSILKLYVIDNKVQKIQKGNLFWTIAYNKSNLVQKISGSHSASYEYNNQLLSSVQNGYNNSYRYEYKNGYLSKTFFPKDMKTEILYNDKMEIIGFIDTDKCLESYVFSPGKESLVTKTCDKKEVVKDKYIFENKKIKKYISNSEEQFKAVLYDTKCQKPAEIVSTHKNGNKKMVKYAYNKNCNVVKIEDSIKNKTFLLEYKNNNVTKIKINNTDKMTLFYNKNNKIETINHSSLGKMEITYSKRTNSILEVYPTNTELAKEFSNIASILEPSF